MPSSWRNSTYGKPMMTGSIGTSSAKPLWLGSVVPQFPVQPITWRIAVIPATFDVTDAPLKSTIPNCS